MSVSVQHQHQSEVPTTTAPTNPVHELVGGRQRHYFVVVDGVFICECGDTADRQGRVCSEVLRATDIK